MDPMIQMQHNIRQNADELQDFLRDLNQWKEEMTRKDNDLRTQLNALGTNGDEILPPIRSSKTLKNTAGNSHKRKKDKQLEKNDKPSKPKRISSYDYDAWAKFDVDKACEEVDEVKKISSEEEEEEEEDEEDEDYEELRRKDQASEAKEQGNDYFKMGKFEQAVEAYTRGMLLDPQNPILPANRALALLKLERHATAEQDCNLAIALDKSYIKAFHRRGCARVALKKFTEAAEDFQAVLKLSPGNRPALEELQKLKELENEVETKEINDSNGSLFKKITVTETGINEKIEDLKKIAQSEACEEKMDTEQALNKEETLTVSGRVYPVEIPPHLRSKKPLRRIEITEISEQYEQLTTSETAIVEDFTQKSEIIKDNETPVFRVPGSAVQFHSDWKKMHHSRVQLYNYLKNIPCENYAKLFQHSLESNVLSDILSIYLEFYTRDGLDVYSCLTALSQVQRFKALVMFFSAEDKTVLEKLFAFLAEQKPTESLAELKKIYSF